MNESIRWEQAVRDQFEQMIGKIPKVLQGMARDKVSGKAQALALEDGRDTVNEKDLVDAFFSATPFGFHGPMKTDMTDVGINYQQYGHPE